jgi:hypothetical protein
LWADWRDRCTILLSRKLVISYETNIMVVGDRHSLDSPLSTYPHELACVLHSRFVVNGTGPAPLEIAWGMYLKVSSVEMRAFVEWRFLKHCRAPFSLLLKVSRSD